MPRHKTSPPLLRAPSAILLCILLGGCAARTATPVAISRDGDDRLSCTGIATELTENRAAESASRQRDKEVEQGNVARNVASIFVPGGAFAGAASTDLSNAEQVHARSLADRNERLVNLARTKGCSE